jgi:DNA-binding transcriptional ArsR family regulator
VTEAWGGGAEQVFVALADPTRRRLLELLGARPPSSASALAAVLPVTRQAIVKHLTVLAECGLVHSRRAGRTVLYEVSSEPLIETAAWLQAVAASWDDRLAGLKRRAEES